MPLHDADPRLTLKRLLSGKRPGDYFGLALLI
jgi:hypothetical protein